MCSLSKSTTTSSCSDDDAAGGELRRGPWTVEEDSLLVHYIAAHGEGRWNLLAKRSGKHICSLPRKLSSKSMFLFIQSFNCTVLLKFRVVYT